MPQAVVDGLEVVYIEEQHGQLQARGLQASNRVIEPIPKQRLVGKAGECVVKGLVCQLGFEASPLGHVPEAPDASDNEPLYELGSGITFEDPTVVEVDDVVAFGLRSRYRALRSSQ